LLAANHPQAAVDAMGSHGNSNVIGLGLTAFAMAGGFSRGSRFLKNLFFGKKEGVAARTAPQQQPPSTETWVEDGWWKGEKIRISPVEGKEDGAWVIVDFQELKGRSRRVLLTMATGPLYDTNVSKRIDANLVTCKIIFPLEEAERVGLAQT